MSRYQSKYENLRAKMDATMLTLNQAKSVGNNARYNGQGGSPLRSNSPPARDYGVQASRTEAPVNQRRFDLTQSNKSQNKSTRKRSGSSLRKRPAPEHNAHSQARTSANTAPFNDMIHQIETLQRERDHYAQEAFAQKQKNADLEREFHTLRELISQAQRPVGTEENLMLRNQYEHEREVRIQAENDLSRVRQQLADQLQNSHRDISNLKKALSDMQQLNNKNLQTIYEKGDQNLEQMQQIEDLSAIIRVKDTKINELDQRCDELAEESRQYHQQMINLKEEHAAENAKRGEEMMKKLNSKMGGIGMSSQKNKENEMVTPNKNAASQMDRIAKMLNK